MKILFDQGTPVPLRRHLVGHTVTTAYEQGWSNLTNGKLLNAAVQAGYELLITSPSTRALAVSLGAAWLARKMTSPKLGYGAGATAEPYLACGRMRPLDWQRYADACP